jgi:hypothetical protein
MEHCVGLDVSLKLTAICIVDQAGKIEREGIVSSNPEAMRRLLNRMRRMSPARPVARYRVQTLATGACGAAHVRGFRGSATDVLSLPPNGRVDLPLSSH